MDWVRKFFPGDAPIGEALEQLNRAIYDKFRYAPGSTHNSTPLEAVLKQRAGVCQDLRQDVFRMALSTETPDAEFDVINGGFWTVPMVRKLPSRRLMLFDKDGSNWYPELREGNMTIDFKNLIVGRHESKVLFIWTLEKVPCLGISRNQRRNRRPSSPETESLLRSVLSSKSSAQSQARTIGISRRSENRCYDLIASTQWADVGERSVMRTWRGSYSNPPIQSHKGFRSSSSGANLRISLSSSMACRRRVFASSIRPVTLA
jgi:hypothetical protein